MLKMLAAAVGVTALAGTGIAVTAPAAHAVANPAGSVYVHGTIRLASFTTYAQCVRYARASYNLVTANSSTVTPLGYVSYQGAQGPHFRFQCYPVRSGRWSYATAYTSTSGAPLGSRDLYIDPAQRDDGSVTPIDTESIWAYTHRISSAPGSITVAKCTANLGAIVRAVNSSPKARLVYADTSCRVDPNGAVYYQVAYLGVDGTSGVARDQADPEVTTSLALDFLGYKTPGVDYTNRVQRRAGAHSFFVSK